MALFLLLAICYTYFFPRWADPNQNSRLDMVVAVVDEGTLRIDNYVHNTVDYAKVNGHYYSDKAPGIALLGIPIYAGLEHFLDQPIMSRVTDKLANSAAFQATLRADGTGVLQDKVRFALAQVVLTFIIVALPSAFLGVLIFRLLARFTPSPLARLAVVLAYGLLTPVFPYSGAYYGHQLSAVLLLAVFCLLIGPAPAWSTGKLLLAGLLLGASVVTEYPSILIVSLLFVYALHQLYRVGRWRQIGWIVLAGGIVAAGWMFYNTYVFGGPLALGYSNSELWLTQHDTGFMSLTWPHWDALWGITFGVFRGLFVLSPILLLSLPGFVLWWRSGEYRPAFWVSLLSVLAFFWFNASSVMWWGGFSVGPRYMLPALPFLALPTIFVLRAWGRHAWLWPVFSVLAIWSLVATWGLTLAGQAFPSDTIPNPLMAYAWPNWLSGNIARNYGTLLGLRGFASLIPLAVALLLIIAAWSLTVRQSQAKQLLAFQGLAAPARREANPDGFADPSAT
jgi:hypothetical protein